MDLSSAAGTLSVAQGTEESWGTHSLSFPPHSWRVMSTGGEAVGAALQLATVGSTQILSFCLSWGKEWDHKTTDKKASTILAWLASATALGVTMQATAAVLRGAHSCATPQGPAEVGIPTWMGSWLAAPGA